MGGFVQENAATAATAAAAAAAVVVGGALATWVLGGRKKARAGAAREVAMACHCGQVRFTVDLSVGETKVISCFCSDCRGFGRKLLEKARSQGVEATAVVDEACGGVTHLPIVSKAAVKAVAGVPEHLRLARMVKGSDLTRVYASCCCTPMFNVHGPAGSTMVPVMSLFRANIADAAALPPTSMYFFASESTTDYRPDDKDAVVIEKKPTFLQIWPMLWFMIKGMMRGDGSPNPLAEVADQAVEDFSEG